MGVDRATENERCYTWVPPNWRLRELSLLQEHPTDPMGYEIWRAISRIRLWAESREDRDRLFANPPRHQADRSGRDQIRAVDPALAERLDVFDRLRDRTRPPADRELVDACYRMVLWGEKRGATETSMLFAEAAASLDENNPRLANTAGRVCRRAGERQRAEVWYSRGIGLARSSQNLREYSSGHLGLAAVIRDGGEHYRALKLIRRAGNAAKRAGLRGVAAGAYQDALGVATLSGDFRRALHFAERALHVYPVHHKRLPTFGADLGFLLVCRGLYQPAVSILPDVISRMDRPVERLIVWGTLARAAGGCGDSERYAQALEQIRRAAHVYRSVGDGALYSAAEGARLLGRWKEAAELVEEAIASAKETDSPFVLGLSQELLNEIHHRRPGRRASADADAEGNLLRVLAAEMRMRLLRWRGPTWRPKRGRPPEEDPDQ